ncbi:MAG: S8 family serine peptidase [Bacteroidales bacterium]|nr:S8 family serine peptidase [Bacteroidales bacterium]
MNIKNTLAACSFVFLAIAGYAQNPDFGGNVDQDPGQLDFKKGEILVKFKDDTHIAVFKSGGIVRTGNSDVDDLTKKWAIKGMEKVFRNARLLKSDEFITFPDGTRKQLEQVFNVYKISFDETVDARKVVEEFKQLAGVDFAELNGSAQIVGGIPVSEPFSLPSAPSVFSTNSISGVSPIIPNDPYFNQQWYIPYVKADSLWGYTTGDSTQVIAILDTGVDWLHPDLASKIWENNDEIPENGLDDDGNGFIDDVRGWDFVNDDNDPKDDNSHGTHCAGIAAAETNNGIGIAGVSWGARIMPIKVFQSNGIGYFSDIADGFWYASQNGSTIFSNSWSSGGESLTIRLAMEYAYSKGLIVAAAGNMNYKTDLPFPPWPPYQPNYPACYNWVLGVEATDQTGNNTWFSNFDPTGPVISDGRPYGSMFYNDYDYNYELRAPGVNFISTVPNGLYRVYSGTSMACPLAAGAIALMKSHLPELSNEEVFAKLIQVVKLNQFQAGVMDIKKSTLENPPPDLYFINYSIADTLPGCDADGRADAGETINLFVKIKNAGGAAEDVYTKIRFAEFEDKSVAQIIDSTCSIGSISPYGTLTSTSGINIKIDSNVVDARIISFKLLLWQEGSTDTVFTDITIKVEHGIEIKGTYSGLLHLTGNAYYIVSETAVIDSLLIDPGVTLRFKSNAFIMITKDLYAVGTPDSMITFKGADDSFVHSITMANQANSNFTYCIFEDGAPIGNTYLVNPTKIHHSIFRQNSDKVLFSLKHKGDYQYNLFTENRYYRWNTEGAMLPVWELARFMNNVFASNYDSGNTSVLMIYGHHLAYPQCMDSIVNNTFINNPNYSFGCSDWNGWPTGIYKVKQNYWGTTVPTKVKSQILDFYENSSLSVVEPDTILLKPPKECHGVVWKVEINDQNPQDTIIEPVGTGQQKFTAYFNRPMDTSYTPFVTFGVRAPFTQNVINVNPSWSADSLSWTAWCNIDRSSGDGENTIRVAYAKDPDHFEIPIERSRFKFVIQAASSQSIEFVATPGIGKVYLEWPGDNDGQVLGYNIYRFDSVTNPQPGDTLRLNSNELLTDSLYTDFNVIPDSTYYYAFTTVSTDFSESDFSKIVSAKVLKAPNGDANGDLAVNVLDITSLVAYLLNQDPQPFIFEAGDINGDNTINVLDIIGVVQQIAGMKSGFDANDCMVEERAWLRVEDGKVYLDAEVPVAALQFELAVDSLKEYQILSKAEGFEFAWNQVGNKVYGVFYSMSGEWIEGTDNPLFEITGSRDWAWTEGFGATQDGCYVPIKLKTDNPQPTTDNRLTVYPNPFTQQISIRYDLSQDAMVQIGVWDLSGRLVKKLVQQPQSAGAYTLEWLGSDTNGGKAPAGIYVIRMEINSGVGIPPNVFSEKIVKSGQ